VKIQNQYKPEHLLSQTSIAHNQLVWLLRVKAL